LYKNKRETNAIKATEMLIHENGQSATFKKTQRNYYFKAYLGHDLGVPTGMAYRPKFELFKAQVTR
jgi:hypothetical protein